MKFIYLFTILGFINPMKDELKSWDMFIDQILIIYTYALMLK
jgi:hypothetical protein